MESNRERKKGRENRKIGKGYKGKTKRDRGFL